MKFIAYCNITEKAQFNLINRKEVNYIFSHQKMTRKTLIILIMIGGKYLVDGLPFSIKDDISFVKPAHARYGL